jgi:hypothetical protein
MVSSSIVHMHGTVVGCTEDDEPDGWATHLSAACASSLPFHSFRSVVRVELSVAVAARLADEGNDVRRVQRRRS